MARAPVVRPAAILRWRGTSPLWSGPTYKLRTYIHDTAHADGLGVGQLPPWFDAWRPACLQLVFGPGWLCTCLTHPHSQRIEIGGCSHTLAVCWERSAWDSQARTGRCGGHQTGTACADLKKSTLESEQLTLDTSMHVGSMVDNSLPGSRPFHRALGPSSRAMVIIVPNSPLRERVTNAHTFTVMLLIMIPQIQLMMLRTCTCSPPVATAA